MSRPTKSKVKHESLPPKGEDDLPNLAGKFLYLRADPLRDDEFFLGGFAAIIAGTSSKANQIQSGHWLACLIKHLSPEALQCVFSMILAMKKNLASNPHRNAYAAKACFHFIETTGTPPSKSQLRAYMLTRPEIYKDSPGAEDGKGWTRLWVAAGLDGLRSK